MENSILIAKLMGPVVLVAAIAMLKDPDDLLSMGREFLKSRALIFISGVLALLGGLAVVNFHNIWIASWPVVITLFGWAMVIGGAMRIALPNVVESIGGAMLKHSSMVRVMAIIWLSFGVGISYVGYF
ncbi:MAG: hypothetical protein GKR97_14910 [Rhizobiaceae bacterium]|nr:hypothetical protein [Rhizobiaceae bacterium]